MSVENAEAITPDYKEFAFRKGEVLRVKHSWFKITAIGKKMITMRLLGHDDEAVIKATKLAEKMKGKVWK